MRKPDYAYNTTCFFPFIHVSLSRKTDKLYAERCGGEDSTLNRCQKRFGTRNKSDSCVINQRQQQQPQTAVPPVG